MREERPEQEDLTIDPDGDRSLWQMQQHRADQAQAWKAWVREQNSRRVPELDRGLVRLSGTRMSRLLRDRDKNYEDNATQDEGGDT